MKRRRPYMPAGWHAVTPRIFARDTRRLVEWIKKVFQATGRYQGERPSEIRIGDSNLMIAGVGVRPPTPACLYVYVPDVDATYRRAVRSRARVLEKRSIHPTAIAAAWSRIAGATPGRSRPAAFLIPIPNS